MLYLLWRGGLHQCITIPAQPLVRIAANRFRGCIAGVHEVLRGQGLLEGIWCLDEDETLSVGQSAHMDDVYRAYPQLNDDAFVANYRDEWLR